MELPTARELELEVLLRERESHLTELSDEITTLRRYLSKQSGPSTTEHVTLPPALMSVLLPHINGVASNTMSASATVAGGLNQRMRQLQEENDELYNILKSSETGKLKDEVRGLRRTVAKLEGALKESHQVISSLSTEVEKTHETLMSTSRQINNVQNHAKARSHSPRHSYHPVPQSDSTGNGSANASKLPPTGPRAHKRPRLSEPQASPPPAPPIPRPVASLPPKPQPHGSHHPPPSAPLREHARQPIDKRSNKNKPGLNTKMDVDAEHERLPSPATNNNNHNNGNNNRDRERNRERERNNKERERRERERERERGREWDRDANPTSNASKPLTNNSATRRNGGSNYSNAPSRGGGGGGGGAGRKPSQHHGANAHTSGHDGRTLQERMGL